MNFHEGQRVRWVPTYCRWDKPADVTVVRVYRRGEALLSNGETVDEDGFAQWRRHVVGHVVVDTG